MYCYCGSKLLFDECCLPFIAGIQNPQHCEQLMRSRYSAYCHKNVEYIYQTYHSSKRDENPIAELENFAKISHFINLSILSSESQGCEGFVTFTVSYMQQNIHCQFTEKSRFVLEQGRWYYLNGELEDTPAVKISRNDPCPCNSGKKFKQCTAHRISGN